jgi:hypothetical protein
LRFKAAQAPRERVALNRHAITEVSPGDSIFVDLRRWGECWYDQLHLPDSYTFRHVVPATYTRWVTDKHHQENRKQIKLRVDLFDEDLIFDHYDVECWGRRTLFVDSEMILVNEDFARRFPDVLPDNVEKRKRLLAALGPHPSSKGERKKR